MIKKITTSAPAKIFLMGEHTVVYGKPALLTTINKRCKVTITLNENTDKVTIIDKKLKINETFNLNDLIKVTQDARNYWQKFDQSKDILDLKKILNSQLDLVKITIIETFAFYKKQLPNGFTLEIDSNIPLGSGLGSSAALSTAIAAAINGLLHVYFNKDEISAITYISEQRQHGNPSGADNTIVTFGGLLWFRKESELLKTIGIVPVEIPNSFKQTFLFVDTGKPEETTGEMISLVKDFAAKNRLKFSQILDSQEQITRDLLKVLKNEDFGNFKSLIQKGEKNLEDLGVVSEKTQKFIRKIEKVDSVAKVCGAGGITQNSGFVLVVTENIDQIKKIAKDFGFTSFQTELGVEGVKIEPNN